MAHFYHAALTGPWRAVLAEHIAALKQASWPWPVTAGLVGAAEDRAEARQMLAALPLKACEEADSGWEDLTLRLVWQGARQDPQGASLYAHAKGVHTVSPLNDEWRRAMTSRVVGQWIFCARYLAEAEAVGCHWLHPDEYAARGVTSPFFGGNFWWARNEYLATLPEPRIRDGNRHDAEAWIGLGDPVVHDLLPGWPSRAVFGISGPCRGSESDTLRHRALMELDKGNIP